MKSNTDAKSPRSAGTTSEARRGRWPLTRAMSGAWGALGGRRSAPPSVETDESAELRAQAAARAREVLLRDRALSAEHSASVRTKRERVPSAGLLDIARWIADELADGDEVTQRIALDPISTVRARPVDPNAQRRAPDDDGATFDMAALDGLADVLEPADAAEPESVGSEPPGEPIRTRTMARLLGTQGYRERALTIYDYLLAQAPDDEELRAEADALRAKLS